MSQVKNTRLCEEQECDRPHHARGFCMRHYSKTEFKKDSNKQYRSRNPLKIQQWKKDQDKRYRERYPEKVRERSARYRARKEKGSSKLGYVDIRLVDNYLTRVCGICGLNIINNFEVDHIIPLSRNGTHAIENLQLTHPICNRTKHSRLQKEMQLDIMLLRELIND